MEKCWRGFKISQNKTNKPKPFHKEMSSISLRQISSRQTFFD